jgi:hypothetical protein
MHSTEPPPVTPQEGNRYGRGRKSRTPRIAPLWGLPETRVLIPHPTPSRGVSDFPFLTWRATTPTRWTLFPSANKTLYDRAGRECGSCSRPISQGPAQSVAYATMPPALRYSCVPAWWLGWHTGPDSVSGMFGGVGKQRSIPQGVRGELRFSAFKGISAERCEYLPGDGIDSQHPSASCIDCNRAECVCVRKAGNFPAYRA